MRRPDRTIVFFSLMGFFILVFIILPLVTMIGTTSPRSLIETMKDKEVISAIWLSVHTAGLATLIAFIFGVPLAYILARYKFWGKSVIEGMIDIPIVIPHTVAGIALLSVFGQRFLLGRPLSFLGIKFVGAIPGIIVAMLFVSAPFLIDAAKEGFASVNPRLERVARTLGASRFRVFWQVAFPLASKNILSGAIMTWARAVSEFGAVLILVYHPMIAPVLIYERFETYGLSYSRPVAVLLVLVCLSVFIALRVISRRGKV